MDKATTATVYELLRVVDALGKRGDGAEVTKRVISEELHKFRLQVIDELILSLQDEQRRQKGIFYGS